MRVRRLWKVGRRKQFTTAPGIWGMTGQFVPWIFFCFVYPGLSAGEAGNLETPWEQIFKNNNKINKIKKKAQEMPALANSRARKGQLRKLSHSNYPIPANLCRTKMQPHPIQSAKAEFPPSPCCDKAPLVTPHPPAGVVAEKTTWGARTFILAQLTEWLAQNKTKWPTYMQGHYTELKK